MPETPTDIPSQEDGLLRQSKILDEMANSRPLEQLEHEHSECDDSGSEGTVVSDRTVQPQAKEDESSKSTEDHAQHKHHRKALLNPIDDELDRVGNILTQIHSEYYTAYDRRDPSSSQMPLSCDTPLIIQEIKDQVLSGCVVTFTGVIARGTDPAESDIWRSTEEFGGTCVHDLSDRVTHLVTASIGTEKMYRATKMPGIKTVWLAWLQSSIALWKRAPELPFLAQPEGQSAAAAPSQPESPKPSAAAAEEDHTAWDDEFDKWLEEGSDSEGGSEAGGNHDKGSGQNISGGEGDKESSAGEKDDDDVMSANGSSGDDDEE